MNGQQAPAAEEEDPIRARALRNVQAMISDIKVGGTYITMNARFMDALTQFYRDDVAEEFFGTLKNKSIVYVSVQIFVFDQSELFYERLGEAIGTLLKLSRLRICLPDGYAAIPLVACMMKHVRQVKHVQWIFPHGSPSPSDDDSADADADAAFNSLDVALEGNASIKTTTLTLGNTSRSDLAAGVCQSMKGLLGLTDISLCGSAATAFTSNEAESMSKVFQVKYLRSLSLYHVSFADAHASETFGQAVAQSNLTGLHLDARREDTMPLDVPSALAGSHLRKVTLSGVAFLEYGSAMQLCRALADCQLLVLSLSEFDLHVDAISALGRAICSHGLKELQVLHSSVAILNSIGSSLHGAPDLKILRITDQAMEQSIVNVLHGCTQCPDLVELVLIGFNPWTIPMDEAAAECTKQCARLVTICFGALASDEPDMGDMGPNVYTSPAFLAACKAHRVVETIALKSFRTPWCPQLLAELDRVTTKNKETRVHRERFESLAGFRHGRPALSRVLDKINGKPHLLFLALTSNKHLLAREQRRST